MPDSAFKGLIAGFAFGLIFSLAVAQMILQAPGPTMVEWCEEISMVKEDG